MLYSRDALKMRDYTQEDFQTQRDTPLPPRDPEDLMGADAEWVDKYADFFDAGEAEDRMKSVVIPRYSGPKNTRVDVHRLRDYNIQTVEIPGIPNHAQPTNVFLKQTFTLKVQDNTTFNRNYIPRPFSIQRQFRNIVWNCPQASEQFEINTAVHCRLAPFLGDAQMIKNCCQTKRSYRIGRIDQGGSWTEDNYITYTIMEPLLGFQQGYSRIGAIRPMNQGNDIYPLAIQDYSLRFNRYDKTERYKRIIRDVRQVTEYKLGISDAENLMLAEANPQIGTHFINMKITEHEADPPAIVCFSDDSAIQSNKNVSSIEMHCPIFQTYKKQVIINPYLEDHLGNKQASIANTVSIGDPIHPVQAPIMLGIDEGTERCSVKCTTSKGYPSYIMIYLEDFGRNYFDPTFAQSVESNIGTDMFTGGHPTIYEMDIKVFGQSFPIVTKLNHTEIDYLTKKNSHPQCDFDENMKYDPIVLLKLEDIGLGTELTGYPLSKRIEMEIDITQIKLPHSYGFRFAGPDLPIPNIEANVVFIYENHVLEGSNGQCKFVWKY